MGLRALSLADTVDYVSDRDPSKTWKELPVDPNKPDGPKESKAVIEDGATIFKLRPLDVFLMGRIYDNATEFVRKNDNDVGIQTHVNQTNIDTVRFGLADLSNFRDAKNTAIKLRPVKTTVNGREYDAVPDDILNMLGIQLIDELAGQIKQISEVDREGVKKSGRA